MPYVGNIGPFGHHHGNSSATGGGTREPPRKRSHESVDYISFEWVCITPSHFKYLFCLVDLVGDEQPIDRFILFLYFFHFPFPSFFLTLHLGPCHHSSASCLHVPPTFFCWATPIALCSSPSSSSFSNLLNSLSKLVFSPLFPPQNKFFRSLNFHCLLCYNFFVLNVLLKSFEILPNANIFFNRKESWRHPFLSF